MIVDDEDSSHDSSLTDSRAREGAAVSLFFCLIGIFTLTVVPLDGKPSIAQVPPTDRTRSVMVVRPNPLAWLGAMPSPSSATVSRIAC